MSCVNKGDFSECIDNKYKKSQWVNADQSHIIFYERLVFILLV